jgi:hypothetical protein
VAHPPAIQEKLQVSRLINALLMVSLSSWSAWPAVSRAAEAHGPEATVVSLNQTITSRDTERLGGHFATGGVQFTLRPSHKGLATQGLTADLGQHWSTIAPVLFAATSSYTREAEILDSRVYGDIATVWARISTKTVAVSSAERTSQTFTEVYLLLNTAGGWKIAAMADNRPADDIGLAAPDPS